MFVIQKHTRAKDVHWDLMLQIGDNLQTYRLEEAPQKVLHHAVNATRILDHPLKFLTYQGPVNKGQGTVQIAEAGIYQIMCKDSNRMELHLSGKILKGKFFLLHTQGNQWLFMTDN